MAKYHIFIPSFIVSHHEVEADNLEDALEKTLETPDTANVEILDDKSITFSEDSWKVMDDQGEVVQSGKEYMIIEASSVRELPEVEDRSNDGGGSDESTRN